MKTLIAGCIVIAALIAGCKKKETPFYPIEDQRLKEGVDFKQGSYFIYRDSASGHEDSLFISFAIEAVTYDDIRGADYEEKSFALVDSHTDIARTFSAGGFKNTDRISGPGTYFGENIKDIVYVRLPFPENTKMVNEGSTYMYKRHHPVFSVAGRQYEDVYEVEISNSYTFLHTYYSLKSGLIRYVSPHGTGELVRQHIVR